MALPLGWTALLLAVAWRHRPLTDRVAELVPTPAVAGPAHASEGRRPSLRATRVAGPLVAAALGLLVAPPLAPLAAAAVWLLPTFRRRRGRRRSEAAVLRSLPEVVDLLVLAAGAGLTVPLAVTAVARRSTGPVAVELARVLDEVGLGRRLADALDDVPTRLGESVRPLVACLLASERYGAPLLDRLVRLAVEARAERRRRAEAAARRVPVKLLFPLVCCTLPAFGLLTVAPLLAGALSTLRP